jgi:hypothetical protein
MIELSILGLITELNLLLSCVAIIPVLLSKIDYPNTAKNSTKQRCKSGKLERLMSRLKSCMLILFGFYSSPCSVLS